MPSSPMRAAPDDPNTAEPVAADLRAADPAIADPATADMWTADRVDLWGPRRPAADRSWTGRFLAAKRFGSSAGGPSKSWGLEDVVFGFFILLVLNLALAAAAFVIALVGVLNRPGVDTSDGAALIGTVLTDMTRLLTTGPGVLVSGLTMWAAFFLAPWLATRNKGANSLATDFGFRFSWRRDLLLGAGFAIGLRIAEALVTWVLVTFGVDMSTAGNSAIITNLSGPWLFIDAFIVAAIGAPIFEELFFRGLVFGALLKNFTRDRDGASPQSAAGRWVSGHVGGAWAGWAVFRRFLYRWRLLLSVLMSSLMFGILHYQGSNTFGSWFVVAATTSVGAVLAVIRHCTGRLGTTMCTHVLFNASGVVLALLTS